MSPKRRSRVEITRDPKGEIVVTLYCEKTKKKLPLLGLTEESAIIISNLLVRIQATGMSLPEVVVDQRQTLSS